jgi:hypothetical protein
VVEKEEEENKKNKRKKRKKRKQRKRKEKKKREKRRHRMKRRKKGSGSRPGQPDNKEIQFMICVPLCLVKKHYSITMITATTTHPGLLQTAANHKVYKRTHFLLFTGSGGSNAARIASSKTFFNPFWKKVRHI